MSSNDRLPHELDCSNLSKEWTTWKQSFMMYMMANDKMKETEERKIATFLWLIGSKARDIYNTLFPNDGSMDSILGINTMDEQYQDAEEEVEHAAAENNIENRKLETILKTFDEYCLPQKKCHNGNF